MLNRRQALGTLATLPIVPSLLTKEAATPTKRDDALNLFKSVYDEKKKHYAKWSDLPRGKPRGFQSSKSIKLKWG